MGLGRSFWVYQLTLPVLGAILPVPVLLHLKDHVGAFEVMASGALIFVGALLPFSVESEIRATQKNLCAQDRDICDGMHQAGIVATVLATAALFGYSLGVQRDLDRYLDCMVSESKTVFGGSEQDPHELVPLAVIEARFNSEFSRCGPTEYVDDFDFKKGSLGRVVSEDPEREARWFSIAAGALCTITLFLSILVRCIIPRKTPRNRRKKGTPVADATLPSQLLTP